MNKNQYCSARVVYIVWGALWLAALLVASGQIDIPEDKVHLTLAFGLLYGFPGWLTVALFGLRRGWSRSQAAALAFGVGVGEALVLGQAALAAGWPPRALAYLILCAALIKLALLVLRPPEAAPLRPALDWAALAQLGIALFGLAALFNAVRFHTVYSLQPSDSWNYLKVEVQFIENPGALNIQEGITATAVNQRLLWNSWLYNRAVIDTVAQADLLESQQRDSVFAVLIMALLVHAALGRELFGERWLAWMAAFFQIGFLSSHETLFTQRVVEDKFFSYYVYIPLITLVLIRFLRQPQRQNFALLVFFSVCAALIHPFNPAALFVTAVPVVLLGWLFNPAKAHVRAALPVMALLGALLLVPLLSQRALEASSALTQPALARSRSVNWLYTVSENLFWNWQPILQQRDYQLSFLILPPLLLAGLIRHGREDAALRFIAAVSAAIILLLWVPPFAALGAAFMTRSQNWRIFMLLPVGYAWAWLASWGWRWLSARLKTRRSLWKTAGGVMVVVAAVIAWDWPGRVPYVNVSAAASPAEIAAFKANRDLVGSGHVLTTTRLAQMLLVLWPDATIPFVGSFYASQEEYEAVAALLAAPDEGDIGAVLRRYGINFVLLPRGAPLARSLPADPCCALAYENEAVVLYRTVQAND